MAWTDEGKLWATIAALLVLLQPTTSPADEPAGADSDQPSNEAVIAELPTYQLLPFTIAVDMPLEKGGSLSLLIDTGLPCSMLSFDSAKAAGVKARKGRPGPYTCNTGLGRELEFFLDTSTAYAELKEGMKYGFLGGNFLQHFVIEFDFAQEQVRFLDPTLYRVPEVATNPDEVILPIQIRDGRPYAKIAINERELLVVLSTAAPTAMIISNGGAEKLGIKPRSLPKVPEIFTTQGQLQSRFYDSDGFRLGSLDFGPSPMLVVQNGFYQGSSDSLVGYYALSQFQIRIDYPRKRIWLKRVSEGESHLGLHYAEARKAGAIMLEEGGEFRVQAVLPDTPAARLGLEVDDVILQPGTLGSYSLAKMVERITAGAPIEVYRQTNRRDDLEQNVVRLPSESAYQAAMERDRIARSKAMADNEEQRKREFEKKKLARTYVRTESGWSIVDEHRISRGPREGEEWFSHEEYLQIRATEAAKQ